MEYVILGLLMIEPSTIYSLNKSFEQGISLFFSPSLGSINNAVKRLIEKNLVTQKDTIENGRSKKILTITEDGEQHFIDWMYSPLDLKNLEASFLSRLFFLGLVQENAQKKALLEGMYASVKASKDTLDKTAETLEAMQIPEAYMGIFTYQKKVLYYGIDTHDFSLGFIERLIAEMD